MGSFRGAEGGLRFANQKSPLPSGLIILRRGCQTLDAGGGLLYAHAPDGPAAEVVMKRFAKICVITSGLLLALPPTSGILAQASGASVSPAVDAAFAAILAHPGVVKALDDIKADDARTLQEQKRITEIPAPPFKEKARAEYYLKRMQDLGLTEAAIDTEGNVIAPRKGSGGKPKLVISAHLDSVFPEGTDVTVREKDGVLRAPGI